MHTLVINDNRYTGYIQTTMLKYKYTIITDSINHRGVAAYKQSAARLTLY